MRTTVDIPDELYEQAESKATQEGIPMGDLIAEGLRLALGKGYLTVGKRVVFPLHRSTRPGALDAEAVRAAEETAARQEDSARAGTL